MGGHEMTECAVCGREIRAREDVVTVGDHLVRYHCAEPAEKPKRRKLGIWASMGSSGQMAMGDTQTESESHRDSD